MALPVASASGRRAARGTSPRKKALEKALQPFTLAHFHAWASLLTFDNDERVVIEPFQDAFLADVFAGVPEVWLVVPEGNGKTTLVALLTLYHAEFRSRASVPVAASSREQAEVLYRQAEGFVLRDGSPLHRVVHSDLQAAKGKVKTDVPRFTCLEGYRRINHFTGARIQVFAADDATGDGVIPTLAILDELHRHKSLALYRTWAGKLHKRGGQLVTISTAGEPGSEFEITRERIRKEAAEVVRTGSHIRASSPRVVLHEWALPDRVHPEDMAAVKAANPFSGITEDSLREKYSSATMTLGHWLRLTCNRPTRAQNTAITEAEWGKAKTADVIPAGEPVDVGLDVAWKWDTTAAVPLWIRDPEYRLLGPAEIVTPPRDGQSTDPAKIEAALHRINARNPIRTIVMDTSRAEQLGQWAESEFGCLVLDWPQGLPAQVLEFERFMEALRKGWLHHSGDAGLTSHALNAIARVLPLGDAVFDRPSQTRISAEQDRRVIDALKAAAMVHSFAATPAPKKAEAQFAWA
jgi:phage terminase large subunit-like protein